MAGGHRSNNPSRLRMIIMITLSLAAVFWIHFDMPQKRAALKNSVGNELFCSGRLIYMYDLPTMFNKDIVDMCYKLPKVGGMGTDRCSQLAAWGFGTRYRKIKAREIRNSGGSNAWWSTDPGTLELIFHRRIQLHPCLTDDPQKADLFYVPVYFGLDGEHNLEKESYAERDALGVKLSEYLSRQKYFKRRNGADHFFVLGHTTWSFRREDIPNGTYGANMENMPVIEKMMKLEVERHPYRPGNSMGIPFPTDFHPLTTNQVRRWQAALRKKKRKFEYVVVVPSKIDASSDRYNTQQAIFGQCLKSEQCCLVNCTDGCDNAKLMEGFLSARYAVQEGGVLGPRLLVDSMLAGCVPVILWDAIFNQYHRHFPKESDTFTIDLPHTDIPEWTTVDYRLSKVTKERYDRLREVVTKLIPSLIYTDPEHSLPRIRDAFDVAIDWLTSNLTNVKAAYDRPPPPQSELRQESKARKEANGDKKSKLY